MLSRASFPHEKLLGGIIATPRRFAGDSERWYGHMLETDINPYRWTGEPPPHLKRFHRTPEEIVSILEWFPKINFLSTL